MDVKKIEWLLKTTKQHIATAKHAKAIGWTDEGDLYDYSVSIVEEQLAELEELVGMKEAQHGETT